MVEIVVPVLIALLVTVMVFQVALAAGAPWGEFAFGGQNKGVLPARLRVTSAISVVIYLLLITHYLSDWPGKEVANWVLVGFTGLGLVMNTITRSSKERMVWAPTSLVLFVCSLIVAIG